MVSTDICWDLHFSRSNPRQPAARESMQKPTGAALSPHTREGSRASLPRHTQHREQGRLRLQTNTRSLPQHRRQRCRTHPAHGGSGTAAKPTPGHGARQRTRSSGGSPSWGKGAPGGQRAARRAGQRCAATRRGTVPHGQATLYNRGSHSAHAPRDGRAHRGAARAAAASPRRSRSAAPRGEGLIRRPEPQNSGGSR